MLSSVRAAAILLTVVATSYLLQLSDQVVVSRAPQAPHRLVMSVQPEDATSAASSREYFVSRLQVVPVGHRNITLPILMYHYIRRAPSMKADWMGYKLSVTPADFTAQMDWLALN